MMLTNWHVSSHVITVNNDQYNISAFKDLHRKDLHRVTRVMIKIWVPEPRKTDSSIPFLGGLKTSPWTSFHPNSS